MLFAQGSGLDSDAGRVYSMSTACSSMLQWLLDTQTDIRS